MIHYTGCPVCGSENIQPQLSAKDHTVSQKEFPIWHCNACTARFTQDVPGQDDIGAYYASDNYISHSDTKKGFINRLYHLVRQRTLQSKRRLVINETGMMKGEILDIGCGTGAFLHKCRKLVGAPQDWNPMKLRGKRRQNYTNLNPWHQKNYLNWHLQRITPLQCGMCWNTYMTCTHT